MHEENGGDLPPEETVEGSRPPVDRERRRIRRRSGLERRRSENESYRGGEERPRHHRHGHALLWILLFGALVLVETVALILMYAHSSLVAQEQRTLSETTEQAARELAELRAQLPHMRQELATLVREHRPELRPLVFDQVIPIDKGHVKSILFMVYGVGEAKIHEYQLVLTNPTRAALHEPINILLFDQAGVEVGRIPVGTSRQGKTLIDLEPGEVRTYSGRVDFQQDMAGEPLYFMLL